MGWWGWPEVAENGGDAVRFGQREGEGADMCGPHVSDGGERRQCDTEDATPRGRRLFTKVRRAHGPIGPAGAMAAYEGGAG
jgi:hypothetical protein